MNSHRIVLSQSTQSFVFWVPFRKTTLVIAVTRHCDYWRLDFTPCRFFSCVEKSMLVININGPCCLSTHKDLITYQYKSSSNAKRTSLPINPKRSSMTINLKGHYCLSTQKGIVVFQLKNASISMNPNGP